MVMLADTDAGSFSIAAQSGARWADRIALPEIVLVSILYVAREMTVRKRPVPFDDRRPALRRCA